MHKNAKCGVGVCLPFVVWSFGAPNTHPHTNAAGTTPDHFLVTTTTTMMTMTMIAMIASRMNIFLRLDFCSLLADLSSVTPFSTCVCALSMFPSAVLRPVCWSSTWACSSWYMPCSSFMSRSTSRMPLSFSVCSASSVSSSASSTWRNSCIRTARCPPAGPPPAPAPPSAWWPPAAPAAPGASPIGCAFSLARVSRSVASNSERICRSALRSEAQSLASGPLWGACASIAVALLSASVKRCRTRFSFLRCASPSLSVPTRRACVA
mmetsp:Transcript_10846/g.33613  ORF Transcript_10846/g.33613 Transcript_10846/m.33613 type:complete len:265 (-) Transcript_10846:235-1029(-)